MMKSDKAKDYNRARVLFDNAKAQYSSSLGKAASRPDGIFVRVCDTARLKKMGRMEKPEEDNWRDQDCYIVCFDPDRVRDKLLNMLKDDFLHFTYGVIVIGEQWILRMYLLDTVPPAHWDQAYKILKAYLETLLQFEEYKVEITRRRQNMKRIR